MRITSSGCTRSKRNEKDARHNQGHYFESKADDARHVEEAERELMKVKMDARRKAKLKLEELRLLREMDDWS